MSTSESPRRAPKRKATGPQQNDRKRAQNRISQQCLRERHAAKARHLENAMRAMKSASDVDGKEGYATLLQSHMALMEENRCLEDALFRLRKKLLSLSNAASTAADDPIFDTVLNRDSKGSQAATTAAAPAAAASPGGLVSPESSKDEPSSTPSHSPPPGTTTPGPRKSSRGPIDVRQRSVDADDSLSKPIRDAGMSESIEYDEQQLDPLLFFDSSVLDQFSFDATTNYLPSAMPSLRCLDSITIRSPVVFTEMILAASIKYVERAHDLPHLRNLTRSQVKEQVAIAAVNMLATASGLESYLYGVNGAHHMEKVLHWRLCKGDRSCVPKPFRPTALQSSQAKPQLAVDFLNWPDIRDQLLLNMASIDLDTLTRDIVLNTVIEVPQRNVAINVFDLFQNGILNGGPRPACNLFDPNWVYFEITVFDEDFDASAADPVEEAIIRELARRVHRFTATSALTQNREPDFELGGPAGTDAGQMETPLGQVDQRFRKNGLAAVLGLGNASAWKLSKEFAQGYPFLDCSSAVSKFEMCSFKSDFPQGIQGFA